MLRHKEWGSALTWALRSVDTSLHSAIADYILHFCPPEVISSIAVLEQMSEIMLKTPALVFLHEYRKFQNLLRDGDKTEAVNLLVCYRNFIKFQKFLIVEDLFFTKFFYFHIFILLIQSKR